MATAGVSGFGAVCGHDAAKAQLQRAMARERLAHALLVTGPDGVGKQLLMRALAMHLACGSVIHATGEACGTCDACRQVAAGSHPDVRIVGLPKEKREIRIEPIRELRAFMQLAPLTARRKVAMINDAHALNGNAQNALLKILEEPPPRSLLLLVTHSPGSLLPTVRSRCQQVRCGPLPNDVVSDILQRVHQMPAAEAALAAAYAEGSPGRALQMRGMLGERRQLLLDLAALPSAGYGRLTEMIRDAIGRDEPALPLAMLLTWYRDQAVRAVGAAEAVGLHQSDRLPASAMVVAALLPAAVRGADAVTETLARLRRGNPNRQLVLEALFLQLQRG